MDEDVAHKDNVIISIVKRTKVGLSAPYFYTNDEIRDAHRTAVAGGSGRARLFSDVASFVIEAETAMVEGCRGRVYSERELARVVFGKEVSAELGHMMMQYLLLDRLAFASCSDGELPILKQKHYVTPKAIPENLMAAIKKYEDWPGVWLQFCQDYANTYGSQGAPKHDANSVSINSNCVAPDPGQLNELISDIVGAAEVSAAKSKVHGAENNLLYAALGLNALMLVSLHVELYG